MHPNKANLTESSMVKALAEVIASGLFDQLRALELDHIILRYSEGWLTGYPSVTHCFATSPPIGRRKELLWLGTCSSKPCRS